MHIHFDKIHVLQIVRILVNMIHYLCASFINEYVIMSTGHRMNK